MMKLIFAFLIAGTAALAQTASPVWFKVSAGGDTLTVTKGTTLRYGMAASTYAFDCTEPKLCGAHKAGEASASAWSPAVSTQADGAFVAGDAFFGGDPIYDVYKEVDVQETAAAQVITVTPANGSAAYTVTVPALTPPAPVLTITLDTAGVQLSSCIDKLANDSNGDEYFVLICKNVPK